MSNLEINKLSINGQSIYEAAFVFYFTDFFLQFTTFMNFFEKNTFHMFSYLGLGLVIFKLFFLDHQTTKRFIVNLLALGFLVLTWRTSSDFMLFSMGIFILGAREIEFNRIVYLYFYIGIIILTFVMISALSGIIPNLIYRREQVTGTIRQSFGIVYPTDFAAHVLYLVLAYCYLFFKRITIKSYLFFCLLAYLLIYFCDARLSALSLVILIPIIIIGKAAQNENKIAKKVANYYWCIPVLAAYTILLLTYFYNPSNYVLQKINNLLSGRLALGEKGISQYGFSLFGQHIDEYSWGGTTGMKMFMTNQSKYFFIDSSFIRILIMYGIIAFFIILGIMTVISFRLIRQGTYVLATIFVIISISAIVEQRLLDISYDPFLIALYANIYSQKNKKSQEEKL